MPMRSGIGRRQTKNSPIRSEEGFGKFKPRQIFLLYGMPQKLKDVTID